MLNLAAIKPDSSGKYSPLLYKWLTRRRQKAMFKQAKPNVFHVKRKTMDGRDDWLPELSPRDLIFGLGEFAHDGQPLNIGGRRLSDIIRGDYGVLTQSFYYGSDFGLLDITDEFWAAYERDGRCVWDRDHSMHMIGDGNRWHYHSGGRGRRCRWCGTEQVSNVERRVEVIETVREAWAPYRASVPAAITWPRGSMGETL